MALVYVLLVAYFIGDLPADRLAAVRATRQRRAAIRTLFLSSGPFAVRRFVVAVVLETLQGMQARWARTHVGKEGGEVFAPTLTDANPATTVIGVLRHLWVEASGFHVRPDRVLGRVPHAVRTIAFACFSVAKATTRLAVTRTEIVGCNKDRPSTVASTEPLTGSAGIARTFLDCCEFGEPPPGQVGFNCHA